MPNPGDQSGRVAFVAVAENGPTRSGRSPPRVVADDREHRLRLVSCASVIAAKDSASSGRVRAEHDGARAQNSDSSGDKLISVNVAEDEAREDKEDHYSIGATMERTKIHCLRCHSYNDE